MTSWLPSWKYDVISETRLRQSMHIYLENISVEFHLDPIWNDGALGFCEERRSNKNIKMSSDIGSVPDSKMQFCCYGEWVTLTRCLSVCVEACVWRWRTTRTCWRKTAASRKLVSSGSTRHSTSCTMSGATTAPHTWLIQIRARLLTGRSPWRRTVVVQEVVTKTRRTVCSSGRGSLLPTESWPEPNCINVSFTLVWFLCAYISVSVYACQWSQQNDSPYRPTWLCNVDIALRTLRYR